MKLKEDIHSITYLKNNAADLLKQINNTHRHVVITQNGEPQAILQDPENFEKTQQAIAMLKLLLSRQSKREENPPVKHEQAMRSVRKRLAKKALHVS